VIEHPVKFPKPDHSKDADQQPKQDLVSREHDEQRDRPKRDRADEPQNEGRTRSRDCGICPGFLQGCRHALHHSQGTIRAQAKTNRVLAMRLRRGRRSGSLLLRRLRWTGRSFLFCRRWRWRSSRRRRKHGPARRPRCLPFTLYCP